MELEKRDKNELDGSTPGPPPISPTLVQYTQTATQYPSQAPPDYYYVAPQLQHGAPPYGNSAAYPPQRADTHLNVVTTVPILSNVCCSSRVGIPDQNRVVISGVARYRHGVLTSTRYTYADELPCRTSAMLVWLVMCVFLSTPVSLLCSVPGYYFIHRVSSGTEHNPNLY